MSQHNRQPGYNTGNSPVTAPLAGRSQQRPEQQQQQRPERRPGMAATHLTAGRHTGPDAAAPDCHDTIGHPTGLFRINASPRPEGYFTPTGS